MIKFFRTKWFDIGIVLAFIIIKGVLMNSHRMSYVSMALWMGLAALLLHHAEEYHWPGNFPQWINKIFYRGKRPGTSSFNVQAAFIINVGVEWTTFLLAAFFAEDAWWLGIATMIFCFGNFIKHTFYYNLKAKTRYNPGMLTSVLCLLPVSLFFFWSIIKYDIAGTLDYIIGVPLGIFFTLVSSVKLVEWLKQVKMHYAFPSHS
ncbi:MAG: hypothetical protein NVSMB7_02940 [Chitinophagaceae bacterium]